MANVWWIIKVVHYQTYAFWERVKNPQRKDGFVFQKRKAHFSHLHKYRISMQKVIEK